MEVHKHAHHVTHKKKWGEYLLEFFMLFLAVFLGFVAENLREHQVEKGRAEQYVYSLYQDLQKDTAESNLCIDDAISRIATGNEINSCFDSINNGASSDCLKQIILNNSGFKDFIYNDRTIQQLKNAGGLRLIQDKTIADSIIAYDALIREMHIHQTVLENLQQVSKNAHNNMIDYSHLNELYATGNTEKIKLLSGDRAELNRYFNAISQFEVGVVRQLWWMRKIKEKATGLLVFLGERL